MLIAADVENPLGLTPSLASDGALVAKDFDLCLEGDLCLVRFDASGEVEQALLCVGSSISIGGRKHGPLP